MTTRTIRIGAAISCLGLACGAEPMTPTATGSFLCERWSTPRPSAPRVTVDLYVASAPGGGVVTAAHRDRVQALGGRVLHAFNVGIIRAELDTAAVRELVLGPDRIIRSARAVPDLRRRAPRVLVYFNRRTTAEDSALLARYGGQNVRRRGLPVIVEATLPDEVIPRVRQLPDVRYVQPQMTVCGRAGA